MASEQLQSIKGLFTCKTDYCWKNVDSLLEDSVGQMGMAQTIDHYDQWKILSNKLNNTSKLTCLGDRNHRLMLLEFIKEEAVQEYKSSYFNRAKIRAQHIEYLKKIGPYVFTEVITIVNKLPLIKKYHFKDISDSFSEDHIHLKIKEILNTTESKKRAQNTNIYKFIKIVQFQDREGLTKQLGKLLRSAWTKEKEAEHQLQLIDPNIPSLESEYVKNRSSNKEGFNYSEMELIGSYIDDRRSDIYNDEWI